MGNPAEALRVCERGMALAGGDLRLGADWVGLSPYLGMTAGRGQALMCAGRLAEASEIEERMERLAVEHGDLEAAAVACFGGARTAGRAGDTGAALRLATRAVELGERIASPFFRVSGRSALAEALAEAGEWDAAIAAAEGGLDILRRQNRIVFSEFLLLAALARAHLGAGDHARARAAAREVLALSARFPDPRFPRLVGSAAAAHVLLGTDGATAEAVGALEQAESLAAAIPDRFFEASLHLERAELARLTGDQATRERELRGAHRLFIEMGATGHAERLARELSA